MVRSARMSEKPQPIRSHTFERTVLAILMVLLIAAAVGVSVMVAHFRRIQAANRLTLPNGAQVEILGAAMGDTPFTIEKPWQKFARQYLPGRLKRLVPAGIAADRWSGLDSNSVSVFLRVSAAPPPAGFFPWGSGDPEDAAGFLYLNSGAGSMSPGTWSNAVCRLVFMSYPRRQKDFLLRFANNVGAAVGALRVPNPSSGPFPQWHPMPLPQTRTNGPVALTLVGLQEQLMAVGTRPDLGGLKHWPEIVPLTEVVSGDPKWTDARANSVTFRDATGNTGRLSPREPAWKACISVYRNSSTSFGPDEKLVITNLPIPAPGSFMTLNQGTNLGGVGVNVRFLAGAGELTLRSNTFVSMKPLPSSLSKGYDGGGGDGRTTEWWESSRPNLWVETTNAQPDEQIEVFVHYDAGNDPYSEQNHYRSYGNKYRNPSIYKVPFKPPPEAKSFTVTVLISRPLPFEFMINPADIQRAGQ